MQPRFASNRGEGCRLGDEFYTAQVSLVRRNVGPRCGSQPAVAVKAVWSAGRFALFVDLPLGLRPESSF